MRHVLYHNPRCSKSRQALKLLEERGVEPVIVLYLETPPSAAELKQLLKKLGLPPRALMRTKEALYRELGLDTPGLTDARLIDAMAKDPELIERPILVKGDRAVIGRPPDKILEIL